MATHVELPQPGGMPLRTLAAPRRLAAGATVGLAGLAGFAVPLVLYGWSSDTHSALELPMAVTAWLFGLEHFVQNAYLWGPIVLGAAILAGVWVVGGTAFCAIADRVLTVRSSIGSAIAGLVWGAAAFLVSSGMVLLARDGAPFHPTSTFDGFVAPTWTWVVGFLVSGVVTGLGYRALRERAIR